MEGHAVRVELRPELSGRVWKRLKPKITAFAIAQFRLYRGRSSNYHRIKEGRMTSSEIVNEIR